MTPSRTIAIVEADIDPVVVETLAAGIPDAVCWRPGGRRAQRPCWSTDPGALSAWVKGEGSRPRPRRLRPRQLSTNRASVLPAGTVLVVPTTLAWSPDLMAILDRRRDLRAVALADWPAALDWPEYAAADAPSALAAVAAMVDRAAVIVAPDPVAARRLAEHRPAAAGRIVVEPMPSPLAGAPQTAVAAVSVMVAAGPIEARANTLLLLQLWRDALARQTPLPKLVLAGQRGAQVEEIAPLLDWNEALRSVVAEAPGLPAPALRQVIAGARALLVPDFGGPCLPLVRDALAIGVPVLAAETPEGRSLAGITCLDPMDGPAWRAAIGAAAAASGQARPLPPLPDWPAYAARILARIETLP